MSNSEIKINKSDLKVRLGMLEKEKEGLVISDLETNITSTSEALDRFVSIYGEYKKVLESYLLLLSSDLQNITTSVKTIENVENSLSQDILSLDFSPLSRTKEKK